MHSRKSIRKFLFIFVFIFFFFFLLYNLIIFTIEFRSKNKFFNFHDKSIIMNSECCPINKYIFCDKLLYAVLLFSF